MGGYKKGQKYKTFSHFDIKYFFAPFVLTAKRHWVESRIRCSSKV